MNRLYKTGLIYSSLTLFTIIFEFIYMSFSHGMSSNSMTFLFLVPLILGCIFHFALGIISPKLCKHKLYRLFTNLYNTAVAILMVGLLLKGILEIAGGYSPHLKFYFGSSYVLFGISAIVLITILIKSEKTVR